ncbi:hypothetical protein PMIN07_000575 [Paraphaeosphaeria minitans]
MDKDALFTRLSQRKGLQSLQIDLDPGLALLPILTGAHALPSPFASLRRCSIMCYPEIALALPTHLRMLEEDLVRSWARPLLAHFPRLEILEAWGDFSGEDNESLNYLLPTQEILASTWEFLSGIEQDLWEDDEDIFKDSFEEGDSWHSLEDWEKASLINEFAFGEDGPEDVHEVYPDMGKLALRDEEPEGMITPGRNVESDDYFEDSPVHP